MAQSLYYASTAVSMTLSAGIASGDTTCVLSSTTGLPASFPFKLLLDWGAASQEVVYCTALAGTTATIQRGKDGSTAQAHSIGASVVHGVSAEEFNNADAHRGASSNVHGLAVGSSVVGTTDTQTLTGKTLTSPTITSATASGTTNLSGTLTSTATATFTASGAGVTPVTIKGATSQSANLAEWRNSGATLLGYIDNFGDVALQNAGFYSNLPGVGLSTASAWNVMGANSLGLPALIVKTFPNSTQDIQQWHDKNGSIAGKFDQSGVLTANGGLYAGGNLILNVVRPSILFEDAIRVNTLAMATNAGDLQSGSSGGDWVMLCQTGLRLGDGTNYKPMYASAFNVTSSAAVKEGIEDLSYGLDAVKALRPVQYVYKTDPEKTPRAGFVAEDAATVFPMPVAHDEDGNPVALNYSEYVPLLVAAIQELAARVGA